MESSAKKHEDYSLRNIVLLSFSFMLILTALWTTLNIEQNVLKSIQIEESSFTGDGYISLGIVYSVMALANMLSPSLVAVLKAKTTLITCSCIYILFIINLLFTTTWSLYIVSVLLGIASAGFWTAQGNYVTLNSNKDTITRNTGIFWVFLCVSQFIGNSVVSYFFIGKTHIDLETRIVVLSILAVIGTCGTICLLFLHDTRLIVLRPDGNDCTSQSDEKPISALLSTLKLLKDRNMQLLIVTFLYLGINQCFHSGIYPSSLGFAKQFGTLSKSLVGLSGICNGFGGFCGGGLVILVGTKITAKLGRFPIVIVGMIILTVGYALAYLNTPLDSPFGPTDSFAILDSSPLIALLCSFLLGFGDSLLHTQIYGTLSTLWPLNSSQAFATLNVFKSGAIAIQFFNSTRMGLQGQILILQVVCVFSGVIFFFVDKDMKLKTFTASVESKREKSNANSKPRVSVETLESQA